MKEPREESCLWLRPMPARAEINLLNYFAVQPLMRVGRATASSNSVLVVWAQQHPAQTSERQDNQTHQS